MLPVGHHRRNGLGGTRVVIQRRDQLDEQPRLQEDKSAVAVVVRQRPERLVAQRDLRVELPRLLDCERRAARAASPRSRSIDAAHPVDGDLFHQELVDVLVGQLSTRRPGCLGPQPASRPPLGTGPAYRRPPDCQDCVVAQPRALTPPSALRPAPPRRQPSPAPSRCARTRRRRRSTAGPCCSAAARSACSGSPSGLGSWSTSGRTALRLGRAVLRNCWRGGWPRVALSTPQPTSSSLGLADVTVVVPVHNRPEQLDRLLERAGGRVWPASWSTTPPPMRARPRRSPSATAPPSSGWPPTSDRPRRATPGWPRCTARSSRSSTPTACHPRGGSSLARPLRRPLGGGRGAAHRRRRWARARYEVSRSSLDRGPARRPGAAREPHPLRAERGPRGPHRRGTGIRPLRSCAPRRRGRGPGLAPERGRLGRALRPVQHGRPRGPGHPEGLLGPPGLLRDDGRAVEPTPRRGRGARCISPAGRCSSGPCCWPAGPCSR